MAKPNPRVLKCRQSQLIRTSLLLLIGLGVCSIGAEQATDSRWANLPDTDTHFTVRSYHSLQEWKSRRENLRRQILWAAGLWPMPERTPLNAKIFDRKTYADYTVEKVYFESFPGLLVSGNVYRPRNPTPRQHPAILNPHGHADAGRLHDDEVTSYQARCITFARLGAVAFMWDMVDYNDSARQLTGEYTSPTYWYLHNRSWEHRRDRRALWNINSFGLQLWNSIRALDFLSSLPEVDPERLGCTGESGGGTQTYMLYAVDDRVKAAAPVCMVSAHMQGGCVCENAPGLRIDTNNVEIAAMMAPRPLLLIGATGDWTKNTREVEYPAIKNVYELYGASEQVQYAFFDSAHGYNRNMREAVYPFLTREMGLSIDKGFNEPAYKPETKQDLLSFRDTLPDHALRSHEALVDRLLASAKRQVNALKPSSSEQLKENRELLTIGLQISTGTAPFQIARLDYCCQTTCRAEDIACEEGLFVEKERGAQIPVRVFRPEHPVQGLNAVLIDGRRRASSAESRANLLRGLLASGQTVYAPDVFGIGRAARNISRDSQTSRNGQFFLTFNRSDDAERVYDIVAIIRHFVAAGATTLNTVGFNDAGPLLAIAAALIEPSQKVAVRFAIDGFLFDTSSESQYLNELFIPGILKAGGLPNALALIAPRPLFLHNAHNYVDTSWAEAAYRSAGYSSNFVINKQRKDGDELLGFLTETR